VFHFVVLKQKKHVLEKKTFVLKQAYISKLITVSFLGNHSPVIKVVNFPTPCSNNAEAL